MSTIEEIIKTYNPETINDNKAIVQMPLSFALPFVFVVEHIKNIPLQSSGNFFFRRYLNIYLQIL